MNDGLDKALYDAVRKKAVGYTTSECVDEYSLMDGELCVVKRKITTKEVPPDSFYQNGQSGDKKPDTYLR